LSGFTLAAALDTGRTRQAHRTSNQLAAAGQSGSPGLPRVALERRWPDSV